MSKTLELTEEQLKGFIRGERKILIEWSFSDVHAIRPDLNDDQITQVLYDAAMQHNPVTGITVAIIKALAQKRYPAPKPGKTKVITN